MNASDTKYSSTLPLVPLRDIVVFPHSVMPLFVGRERSIKALEHALEHGNKEVVLAAQKKARTNNPSPDDIHSIGCIALVVQMLKLPDGTVKVLVEGRRRVKLKRLIEGDSYMQAEVESIKEQIEHSIELEALMRSVVDAFDSYAQHHRRIAPELAVTLSQIDEPARLADTLAAHLTLKAEDRQQLLELLNVEERLTRLLELMQSEIEILEVEHKIRSRVKKQMEKAQKDYYLNEQIGSLHKDPGGQGDDFKNELAELEERANKKKLTKEASLRVHKEIRKLKSMSPMSAEATVVRNYVDLILSLPWGDYSRDKLDLEMAENVLNEDHYGLRKIKDRILEYLAVQALSRQSGHKSVRGPVLCLAGPPGVGKTSLARSIARALGRKFVRISLGGVRDEAEIRGHRRTYIGAMPGKIIQALKKSGTSNPLILLDEIDKIATDFRGDPSSALLEVLDPEQNAQFVDHYLDLDYDLSRVMFVCTANNLGAILPPLKDRFEIIQLAGYTEHEKMAIATRYLTSKQQAACGLSKISVNFHRSAMRHVIQEYTREAGVRALEREIESLYRKMAREVLKKQVEASSDEPIAFNVTKESVRKWLGSPKFRFGRKEESDKVGVVTGLAWTQTGGDLLQIEVSLMPGKGKLMITGKLGDVMQESVQAAMSYVRSRCRSWGLPDDFYTRVDLHVHVPEGATPKDGPSAGTAITTALVSALTNTPVRRDVAMTGEITLRGRILPIGGIKEKALAAARAGIETLLIPKENERDVEEIPKSVRRVLKFQYVEHIDEVLAHALVLDNPEAFSQRASLAKPVNLSDLSQEKPPILNEIGTIRPQIHD